MTEILSQDEIDKLLTDIDSGKNRWKKLLKKNRSFFRKILWAIKERIPSVPKDEFYPTYDPTQRSFGDFGEEFNFSEPINFDDPDTSKDRSDPDEAEQDEVMQSVVKGPEVVMTFGGVQFTVDPHCPRCKTEQSRLTDFINDYEHIPDLRMQITDPDKKQLFKKRIPVKPGGWYRCQNCGKIFSPDFLVTQQNDTDPQYTRQETIMELEYWNRKTLKHIIPLFSVRGQTLQTRNGQLNLFWDRFLSDAVDGFKYCPDNIIFHIIKYTPRRDLRRMVNKKKGIPVFSSYDFDAHFILGI